MTLAVPHTEYLAVLAHSRAQHHPGRVLHLQGKWVIPASGHKRAAVLFPVQRVLGLQLQAQLSRLVLRALGEVAADGDPPPAQPPAVARGEGRT